MGVVSLLVVVLIVAVATAEHHNDHHHQHLKEKSHEHHKKINHASARHHHKTNAKDRLHHHGSSHFLHHSFRSNDKIPQCSWVCSNGSAGSASQLDLRVFYNSSLSEFAIESKPQNIALVLNYEADVILLINGKTGVTLILDFRAQQVLKLKDSPQTQGVLWNPSNASLQEYLSNLSIDSFVKVGEQFGEKTNLSSSSNDIEDIFKNFGASLPAQETIELLKQFSSGLKSGLSGLFKGSGSFGLPNSLYWFFNLNVIIGNLLKLGESPIDLSKINIDPKTIFGSASGIEALIKIFAQLGNSTDLSKIVGNIFSSRENSLNFLKYASSGSNNGLDGLITILVNVLKAFSGRGSIGEVINSVIKYNGTGIDEPTFAQVINRALDLAEAQLKQFNNERVFGALLRFLRAWVNNNVFLDEVNICDIAKIFLSPNPIDRFNTVIKLLSTLSPLKTIPAFFHFIHDLRNNSETAQIISGLVPGLNVSQWAGRGLDYLEHLLHGQNLTQFLTSGAFNEVISQIPGLGPVISQISSLIPGGGVLSGIQNFANFSGAGGLGSLIENGIHQFTNSVSGAESGFQHLVNSSPIGAPVEGIVSGIQNGFGSVLGFGGHEESVTQAAGGNETSSNTESPKSNQNLPSVSVNETRKELPTLSQTSGLAVKGGGINDTESLHTNETLTDRASNDKEENIKNTTDTELPKVNETSGALLQTLSPGVSANTTELPKTNSTANNTNINTGVIESDGPKLNETSAPSVSNATSNSTATPPNVTVSEQSTLNLTGINESLGLGSNSEKPEDFKPSKLKGIVAGGFFGGLSFRDKNKDHHAQHRNHQTEEKNHHNKEHSVHEKNHHNKEHLVHEKNHHNKEHLVHEKNHPNKEHLVHEKNHHNKEYSVHEKNHHNKEHSVHEKNHHNKEH